MSAMLPSRQLWAQGPHIVAIGGGTGLSTMLRGLKKYTKNLTAIVTVSDDGGGSGMLRRDIGMLPPGDIRHCMESLANTEPVMQQLLTYRFESGTLRGQCFGNLLLAALNGVTGSFDEAVRSGLDGKEFRIHKFRSMCVDAEAKLADLKLHTEMNGPIFKQKDDPRVTHVGHFIRKCGIDELPQLWDILVGSMSIVGPRPPLPCEVAEYTDYERQRLYVRPGLTCIWQIQPNRNDVTFDEWMDMDMRYIRDRSFLLDWKLIFGTVWTVFAGTGE